MQQLNILSRNLLILQRFGNIFEEIKGINSRKLKGLADDTDSRTTAGRNVENEWCWHDDHSGGIYWIWSVHNAAYQGGSQMKKAGWWCSLYWEGGQAIFWDQTGEFKMATAEFFEETRDPETLELVACRMALTERNQTWVRKVSSGLRLCCDNYKNTRTKVALSCW